jgi:hypothetical protein
MKWVPALGLTLALLARVGQADPPEMDPINLYAVTPAAGAWMVLAASYTGDDGKDLCRQLVLEMRNKHHLPAYVFNLAAAKRREIEEEERARQTRAGVPVRPGHYNIQDHWAVLIGGYKDMNAATAALPSIRKLPLPDLHLAGGKLAYDTVVEAGADEHGKVTGKKVEISPFHNAMCVPNPTIPREEKPAHKFDPFWTELNRFEDYSLLRCSKKFTFAVKEYHGSKVIQSTDSSGGIMSSLSWLTGKSSAHMIDAAGLQAHDLADVLHKKLNFETYVLHTRTSSVVTIGSFDSLDDPQAQRVKQQIQTFQQQLTSAWAPTGKQDPLQLFPQPMPIEVPRP